MKPAACLLIGRSHRLLPFCCANHVHISFKCVFFLTVFASSFPLDRPGRFAGHVLDHAVDTHVTFHTWRVATTQTLSLPKHSNTHVNLELCLENEIERILGHAAERIESGLLEYPCQASLAGLVAKRHTDFLRQ